MADNMQTQVTGKGVIKPVVGIALVVGIAASFFLLDMIIRLLELWGLNTTVGTIALYLIIIVEFLFLLQRFCIVQMYTMDTVKLYLYRVYFRNPRFCEQVLFREVVYFGDPDTAEHKYNITNTHSYASKRDKYPVQTLVIKKGDKYRQILLTPNEQLSKAILEAVKKS